MIEDTIQTPYGKAVICLYSADSLGLFSEPPNKGDGLTINGVKYHLDLRLKKKDGHWVIGGNYSCRAVWTDYNQSGPSKSARTAMEKLVKAVEKHLEQNPRLSCEAEVKALQQQLAAKQEELFEARKKVTDLDMERVDLTHRLTVARKTYGIE